MKDWKDAGISVVFVFQSLSRKKFQDCEDQANKHEEINIFNGIKVHGFNDDRMK